MRTNIEIDDELMKRAMKISGAQTKKAAVEQALQLLVRMKKQEESLTSLFGILKSEDDFEGPGGRDKDKWHEAEQRYAAEARPGRKKAA